MIYFVVIRHDVTGSPISIPLELSLAVPNGGVYQISGSTVFFLLKKYINRPVYKNLLLQVFNPFQNATFFSRHIYVSDCMKFTL